MAQLIFRKLKGSTLVEVTVASVIIVVVFLLASTLIANLWKTGPSQRKLAGHAFLQQKATIFLKKDVEAAEVVLPDGLAFEQVEEPYEGYSDIKQITLKLRETGSGAILDELIFLMPSDEKVED
jgi:hypothetical protein